MGKRSRKRDGGPAVRPPARVVVDRPAAPRAPLDRRARLSELPAAPWAPFPLVELVVLLGLVLMVVGVVAGGDRRGLLILCGVALASLAGLEQATREHFAGFRSHSTLLAGAVAFVVAVLLALAVSAKWMVLAPAAVVFAAAFWLLRRAFARRTGGLGFRA